MRKLLLLFCLFVCFSIIGKSLLAQPFIEKSSDIKEFNRSTSAVADVDGDGDEDLFITGSIDTPTSSTHEMLLYINDGQGNLEEAPNTPFVGVCCLAQISTFDADQDGDIDVAVIGTSSPFSPSTMLYLNDGTGGFTVAGEQPFRRAVTGQISPADVDNDGDMDVVVAGSVFGVGLEPFIELYMNDGTGNFTPKENVAFAEISQTSGTFADVDNDGDLDYILSGGQFGETSLDSEYFTLLYKNDGAGNFTEVENTPFIGMLRGTLEFHDFDGDSDLDLFLMGDTSRVSLPVPVAEMYLNDGEGNFEQFPDLKLDAPVAFGGADFGDVDNDGDLDLLVLGDSLLDNYTTVLYLNEGLGNYQRQNIPFLKLGYGSADLIDIDSDRDLDIVVTGLIFSAPTVVPISGSQVFLNNRATNDNLCNATTIEVDAGCGEISNIDLSAATAEANEPLILCASTDTVVSNSVWYTFVAPEAPVFILAEADDKSTTALDFQLQLFTQTGDCNDLSTLELVACGTHQENLLEGASLFEQLVAGETYYLQVSGRNIEGFGRFEGTGCLTIESISPPENDDVCNATVLEIDAEPTTFSNLGAGVQVGEADITPPFGNPFVQTGVWAFGQNSIEHSVWFTFNTPEAGGSYEIDMDISFGLAGNFNAQLAVYEATDCTDFSTFTLLQADDLNIVEERFSVSLFPKEDVFCLEGNTTYYVLVDGGTDIFGSPTRSEGLFQLQINTKELAPVTAQTYTQGQLCEGEAAGTAIVAGQGGAGEYTYEWSTGATTPDLVYSLESGDYTVTITDQCGDEGVQSITVPAFYRPELAVNLADRTACEGEEVSLAPAVTGGIPLESFRVFTKSPFNLFLGDLTVPFLKETVAERISFEGELAIFREMEMIRGELYSLGRFNQLYLIDVENETVTQVDSIDLPPLRDLSYVPSTDQVYTVTNDGTVYELDIENGTNTLIVNPELPLTETQQIRHAAVDQDGVVYYLTQDFFVEGGTWYAMPLATGVADSIGRFEGNVFLVDAIEIDPFDNSLYHTLEEFQSLALSVHYIVKVDKSNGQEIDRFDDVQADLITAMAIADRPADEPLYDYLWTPEAAFENPTALTQSLVATEEVTYTFSASDFCGTAAQEELTLEVLPVTNVTIDTSILRGETYNGIVIETDTIIFESATTATACENRRVNISVIISSTDQIQAERLVRISPNPTSQILNVSLDGLFSHTPIQLSILDVHGRMIWQQNRQDLQSTIAVGDFQKGLYFLEVRTAEQVVVRQFVKL